jgi:histidine triad (HIT) family protein
MISFVRRHWDRFLPLPLRQLAQAIFRIYYNMGECIFCKIVDGSLKADVVFRDEQVVAFRDLHPAAPTHILVVPKRHINSVNSLEESDAALVGHMFVAAKEIAAQEGLAEDGYRLTVNTGAQGGQTVFHMHLHLIGGRQMRAMG